MHSLLYRRTSLSADGALYRPLGQMLGKSRGVNPPNALAMALLNTPCPNPEVVMPAIVPLLLDVQDLHLLAGRSCKIVC